MNVNHVRSAVVPMHIRRMQLSHVKFGLDEHGPNAAPILVRFRRDRTALPHAVSEYADIDTCMYT